MKVIKFYKRFWDNTNYCNLMVRAARDRKSIVEITFREDFAENGEKIVLMSRLVYVEGNCGAWEIDVDDHWTKELTPDEANKQYLMCKNTPYATQRVPVELNGYV